jgi:type VI secretion system protein ImpF
MADLTPSERLQPCLLDRLTDDHPDEKQESRDARVVSMQRYRQAVLRDIAWLLNTSSHSGEAEFEEFEMVAKSVLNYGTRSVCGQAVLESGAPEMERELTRAIRSFEPRIVKDSVSVSVIPRPENRPQTAVGFEIKGNLWAQPLPESLYIKTEIDLETGQCEVK